jgi:5-methylcytosine-specific restriction endonuclease McrA
MWRFKKENEMLNPLFSRICKIWDPGIETKIANIEKRKIFKENRWKYTKCGYNLSERNRNIIRKAAVNRLVHLKVLLKYISFQEKRAVRHFYNCCPKDCEVDHIKPISKGGLHTIENLKYIKVIK